MELNDRNTTPVHQFEFGTPSGVMYELTCANHTNLRWSTKNPYQRSLFFIGLADDPHDITAKECECPFSDLMVIEPYRRIFFSDGSHYDTNDKNEILDFALAMMRNEDQT